MKVKNVSARLHHIGKVSIAPGETKNIDDAFASAINKNELVPVQAQQDQPRPVGRPRKESEE